MSSTVGAGRRDGNALTLTALLLATMVVTSSMQFIFGVLAPFLTEQFGVSRSSYGVAVSVLFASGVLASFLGGRRLGGAPMRILRLICGLAAIALFLAAGAQAWWWIVVSAALMGVPLGLANPVTNHLVASRLRPGRQGTVVGVKQAGVPIGSLIVGATLPPIALVAGWRVALVGFGLLAIVTTVSAFFVRERATISTQARPPDGLSRYSGLLPVYAGFMGFGMAGINTFLPLFAYETLSFREAEAGLLLAVIGFTGAAARVAMGVFGNRRRQFDALLGVLALGAAISTALLFASPRHGAIIWVAAVGLGISSAAWNSAAMLALVRRGAAAAAAASGYVAAGFLLGQAIGPSVFGLLATQQPTYMWAWGAVTLTFLMAVVTSATSVRLSRSLRTGVVERRGGEHG